MQDGALHLLESLSSETRELVKLDLSSCGLTSEYIFRLNDEISLIGGVIELKLGWNPITQEVFPRNHLINAILAKQINIAWCMSFTVHKFIGSEFYCVKSQAPLDC